MLLAHPLVIKRVGAVVTPTRKIQATPPYARSGQAMQPLRSAANPSFAWLLEDTTLADATLLLRVSGKPAGAASPAGLRVHRAVLGAHSEHFRTQMLRWADGESHRAAQSQPAIAVAHFNEAGSLPVGLTVHQLAQVMRAGREGGEEGGAQGHMIGVGGVGRGHWPPGARHCYAMQVCNEAEACSQAMMALAWKEAVKSQAVLPCLEETFDSLEMCDAAHLVVLCMYKGKLVEEVQDPLTLARVSGLACSGCCNACMGVALCTAFSIPIYFQPDVRTPSRGCVAGSGSPSHNKHHGHHIQQHSKLRSELRGLGTWVGIVTELGGACSAMTTYDAATCLQFSISSTSHRIHN
ncbi:hypothetical protein V8C86DRAFT_1532431 [Haematococcus lacustris]